VYVISDSIDAAGAQAVIYGLNPNDGQSKPKNLIIYQTDRLMLNTNSQKYYTDEKT